MSRVIMYTKNYCPYCVRAKNYLNAIGVQDIEEINIEQASQSDLRAEMIERTGQRTVPQIFINDQHVGGCDDLMALGQPRVEQLLNSCNLKTGDKDE
ncbi:MAG: glutaredoxin 3 [Candidatus Comchoanobacterales bacterium]